MFIFQSVFNVTQFSFLFIILNFSSEYKYYLAVCLTPGAAPWHHWCQPTTPTDHPHALLSRQRMPGADSCRGRVGMCRDGMGTMDGADGVPAARTCRTALSCQRHCEWNMNRSPVKSADTECQPVRVVHFQDCGTHLAMEPNRSRPLCTAPSDVLECVATAGGKLHAVPGMESFKMFHPKWIESAAGHSGFSASSFVLATAI